MQILQNVRLCGITFTFQDFCSKNANDSSPTPPASSSSSLLHFHTSFGWTDCLLFQPGLHDLKGPAELPFQSRSRCCCPQERGHLHACRNLSWNWCEGICWWATPSSHWCWWCSWSWSPGWAQPGLKEVVDKYWLSSTNSNGSGWCSDLLIESILLSLSGDRASNFAKFCHLLDNPPSPRMITLFWNSPEHLVTELFSVPSSYFNYDSIQKTQKLLL